jgi:hypothetical protein
MRFLSVEVDNFLTIGHAELRLHRPGSVVAVLGDNQTAEGYDSNGAGKSSLLPESIGWCLWGETIRKLPADSVVNNKRKRNCQVTVRVRLDKDLLQVTRFRKHKEHGGNGLILKLNDEDITPGTPTLAEEKLKGLLGMDFTTFLSVVAFSPDALRFVSSTDASQKQVLDSILQTRRFSAALEYAKASAKAVLVDRQKVQTALTVARESLSTQEGLLAQYNELNDNFQRREQDRLTGLQVQVDSRWKQVAGLEAQLDVEEASKTATEKQLAEIEIPDTTALQKEYTLLAKDLGLCQGRLTIVRGQRDDIQSELDKAINQAGKPCPTCGQRVANTGRMIIAYQASRNKFRQQVEQYEQQEVTIKEQRKAVGQKLLRAQELQETREELLSKLGGINQRISNYRNSVATHKDHINNLKAQMASAPVNDYKRLIKEAQIQVTKLTHDLADLEQADFAYEHDIAEAEFWVEAFGNSGIRSYLLDQILPELTEYANEYSRKLMGGNIIIEFNTHSGTRDKFQITAMNMDGSDLYVGNSNGEKRRIDVCVMLALFRVALSRTHINVLLLDEVLDSAIDRSGLESMVLLINTLARELKLTVFVTSHTDLNSRIQDCITLRKRDGLTSLVE